MKVTAIVIVNRSAFNASLLDKLSHVIKSPFKDRKVLSGTAILTECSAHFRFMVSLRSCSAFLSANAYYAIIKNLVFFQNYCEQFVFDVFCDSIQDFRERFGKTLFDDGIDCKKFLEDYFKIKL